MKTFSGTVPIAVTKAIGKRDIEYRRKFSALAFDVAMAVENYLNRKSKLHEVDLPAIAPSDLQNPQEAPRDVHSEPDSQITLDEGEKPPPRSTWRLGWPAPAGKPY